MRDDMFCRVIYFTNHPAAEFELEYPELTEDGIETHFCLNLKAVQDRMRNLKMPKNYCNRPRSLLQEMIAEEALLNAMARQYDA